MSTFQRQSHQIHAHTQTNSNTNTNKSQLTLTHILDVPCRACTNIQTIQNIFERFFYSVKVIFIIVILCEFAFIRLMMLHDHFNDA